MNRRTKKEIQASIDAFDLLYGDYRPYPKENAVDLWITVIQQALHDATLGLSDQIRAYGKIYKAPRRAGWAVVDIRAGREFIKGQTSALADICMSLGCEPELIQADLLKIYRECLPHLPEEWQDKNFENNEKISAQNMVCQGTECYDSIHARTASDAQNVVAG